MREIPADLAAHLASGVTTLCWCWKLIRRDGVVAGFTDHDEDIEFDGVRHAARSGFSASEIEETSGLNAANGEAAGALTGDAISEADIAAGLLDGAQAEIWLVNWQEPAMRLLLRKASLGEVTREGVGFRVDLRGAAQALSQPQGRIYQPGCDAVPGDARCGVDLAAPQLRGFGSVIGTQEQGRILRLAGLEAFAADWFSRGVAVLETGERLEVKAHAKGEGAALIELWRVPSIALQTGDRLTLTAGCDRSFSACRSKFNNARNFRGFPHMPGHDFLTSYPVRA